MKKITKISNNNKKPNFNKSLIKIMINFIKIIVKLYSNA